MVRKDCQMRKKNLNPMGRHCYSNSECNRAIDEVMNAEPVGLENDELVEPEHVEESKKVTIQITSNLRNSETHYKLIRELITQDPQKIFMKDV